MQSQQHRPQARPGQPTSGYRKSKARPVPPPSMKHYGIPVPRSCEPIQMPALARGERVVYNPHTPASEPFRCFIVPTTEAHNRRSAERALSPDVREGLLRGTLDIRPVDAERISLLEQQAERESPNSVVANSYCLEMLVKVLPWLYGRGSKNAFNDVIDWPAVARKLNEAQYTTMFGPERSAEYFRRVHVETYGGLRAFVAKRLGFDEMTPPPAAAGPPPPSALYLAEHGFDEFPEEFHQPATQYQLADTYYPEHAGDYVDTGAVYNAEYASPEAQFELSGHDTSVVTVGHRGYDEPMQHMCPCEACADQNASAEYPPPTAVEQHQHVPSYEDHTAAYGQHGANQLLQPPMPVLDQDVSPPHLMQTSVEHGVRVSSVPEASHVATLPAELDSAESLPVRDQINVQLALLSHIRASLRQKMDGSERARLEENVAALESELKELTAKVSVSVKIPTADPVVTFEQDTAVTPGTGKLSGKQRRRRTQLRRMDKKEQAAAANTAAAAAVAMPIDSVVLDVATEDPHSDDGAVDDSPVIAELPQDDVAVPEEEHAVVIPEVTLESESESPAEVDEEEHSQHDDELSSAEEHHPDALAVNGGAQRHQQPQQPTRAPASKVKTPSGNKVLPDHHNSKKKPNKKKEKKSADNRKKSKKKAARDEDDDDDFLEAAMMHVSLIKEQQEANELRKHRERCRAVPAAVKVPFAHLVWCNGDAPFLPKCFPSVYSAASLVPQFQALMRVHPSVCEDPTSSDQLAPHVDVNGTTGSSHLIGDPSTEIRADVSKQPSCAEPTRYDLATMDEDTDRIVRILNDNSLLQRLLDDTEVVFDKVCSLTAAIAEGETKSNPGYEKKLIAGDARWVLLNGARRAVNESLELSGIPDADHARATIMMHARASQFRRTLSIQQLENPHIGLRLTSICPISDAYSFRAVDVLRQSLASFLTRANAWLRVALFDPTATEPQPWESELPPNLLPTSLVQLACHAMATSLIASWAQKHSSISEDVLMVKDLEDMQKLIAILFMVLTTKREAAQRVRSECCGPAEVASATSMILGITSTFLSLTFGLPYTSLIAEHDRRFAVHLSHNGIGATNRMPSAVYRAELASLIRDLQAFFDDGATTEGLLPVASLFPSLVEALCIHLDVTAELDDPAQDRQHLPPCVHVDHNFVAFITSKHFTPLESDAILDVIDHRHCVHLKPESNNTKVDLNGDYSMDPQQLFGVEDPVEESECSCSATTVGDQSDDEEEPGTQHFGSLQAFEEAGGAGPSSSLGGDRDSDSKACISILQDIVHRHYLADIN